MADAAPDAAQPSGPSEAAREAASNAPVGFARKASKNRGNIRKRMAEEEGDDGSGGGVQKKAQKAKDAPLAFTTKRDDKFETFKFESSNVLQQAGDQGATRHLETETEHDRDARAQREKVLAQATAGGGPAAPPDDQYRGMNSYVDYRAGFRREHTVGAEKGSGAHGPLRASTNVRMSIRIDYQPDLCKDYKETGYCGYGDACKFLHDRGDYKAGWEIERDWQEQQKAKREKMLAGWRPDGEEEEAKSDDEEEDDLPFACFICRQPWEECQDPVITRCKHYFCEQCALKQNAQSSKCFVCNQTTGGIFNVAQDIIRRTKQRQRKKEGKE